MEANGPAFQLPPLYDIQNFQQIRRAAKYSSQKLKTIYSLTDTPSKHSFKCFKPLNNGPLSQTRKQLHQKLLMNRLELFDSTHHSRQQMNMSFIRMVRFTEDSSKKRWQHKTKKNRRQILNENHCEILPLAVAQVKKPEKILTSFVVGIQKLDYMNFNKFYGFREGSCLASSQKNLYLEGGYTGQFDNKKSHLNQYDFANKTWRECQQRGDVPSVSKIGQTVQQWKGNLYFIGGMGLNLFGKKRIFSTEIGVYNPERGEWSKIKSLEGRRYHASTRFMHYIVIYGGVNDKEEYLGDITVVNLQNSLSVPLNYRLEEDKMGIAYHRIASTMELDSKKRGDILKDGVYSFGGKDNQSNYVEGLRVLNFQINTNGELTPKEWTQIKTQGREPRPRIGHSMSLLPRLSALMVIGGQSETNQVLRDIFVLNLHNLTWYTPHITFDDFLFKGLSNHASTVIGSRIYIFGGMHYDGKYSTSLVEVETDQNKVHTFSYIKNRKAALDKSP